MAMGFDFGISAAIDAAASLYSQHRQMKFQEEMSSTAYQRAVEDMRKAGLNPSLAYQQGGASSPAGAAMAPTHFGEAVSAYRQYQLEKKQTEAQVRATRQQGDAAESNATSAWRMANVAEQKLLRENPPEFAAAMREKALAVRDEDVKQARKSTEYLGKEFEGLTSDLEQKKFDAAMFRSLTESMGKMFGEGSMRNIANLVLMVLRSNAASSAFRSMVGGGRR